MLNSYAIEQNTDDIVISAVAEAIGALQEARRLKRLHAKGCIPNYERQLRNLAEELFLSLDYLQVDIDEFTELLKKEADKYD